MKKTILIFLIATLSGTANADFLNGNKLKELMIEARAMDNNASNASSYKSAFYSGYVTGVADASFDVRWCPRPTITVGQIKNVVAKFLDDNPAELDKSAESLITAALSQAFPCSRR